MLVGVGVVAVMAVLFGLTLVVAHAKGQQVDAAWRRIAVARRSVAEHVRDLEERELRIEVLQEQLNQRERRLDFREQLQFAHEEELARLEREEPPGVAR
jgi:chromosome segregation ATPase